MADRLRVTELDFDTIKTNLKTFLKQQSEFTDYDFDGSGLSILLDILAYNTHYNAYYLNMVANESFLDTALLRDSVVSHAKLLGYTPSSRKSPVAVINFSVNSSNTDESTLTLPKGFSFFSNQIDGKSYNFVTLNDVTVAKANGVFKFENLNIYEGQVANFAYEQNDDVNPKQIFTIPDSDIDINTLAISVTPSSSSSEISVYTKVNNLLDVTANSEVYFIQEHKNGQYQVYFGDDILGKKLPDGAIVYASYLVTSAETANKANNFVANGVLVDSLNESLTNFNIVSVSAASGGSERESLDKIKYLAPLQYTSQNRAVTIKDYELFLEKNYTNAESISVWGGEDEDPPIFGKIYFSLKPKDNFFLSETEKQRIIDEIILPNSVVTVKPEYRDPEFLFLVIKTTVKYDPKKTTLPQNTLITQIRNAIINYRDTSLDKFGSVFTLSKFQEIIDDVDTNSIIGSDTIIRLQKRFLPVKNRPENYVLNFETSLLPGIPTNKLESSEFDVLDTSGTTRTVILEEVPKSFTGVNAINIVDAGTGYTSAPTVTITGDGVGATATAVIEFGRLKSIEVTNPGFDYNRAVVTISGGGGFGATATAVLETNVGKLRTVYFTPLAERVIVNSNAGEINYDTGKISLNDLNIKNTNSADGYIRVTCPVKESIIETTKNSILTIDDNESSSISITIQN